MSSVGIIEFEELTGPATVAHFHKGEVDEAGPVVLDLETDLGVIFSGVGQTSGYVFRWVKHYPVLISTIFWQGSGTSTYILMLTNLGSFVDRSGWKLLPRSITWGYLDVLTSSRAYSAFLLDADKLKKRIDSKNFQTSSESNRGH